MKKKKSYWEYRLGSNLIIYILIILAWLLPYACFTLYIQPNNFILWAILSIGWVVFLIILLDYSDFKGCLW